MTEKQSKRFQKFIQTEMKKIDLDKYFQGIKIQNDPGDEFVLQWIKENAQNWRNEWEQSVCKDCFHWNECGLKVRKECENYKIDNDD